MLRAARIGAARRTSVGRRDVPSASAGECKDPIGLGKQQLGMEGRRLREARPGRAGDETPDRDALVFAIAHEVGNHLGAIRLQAHLLDDDLDARGLAAGSLAIDELAARSAPLLALLRPILGSGPVPRPAEAGAGGTTEDPGIGWDRLLDALARELEDEGTRGVRVTIAPCDEPPPRLPQTDWMAPLLRALVASTLAHLVPRGQLAVRVTALPGGASRLDLEDDGAEEDLAPGAALRGRALVVGIARRLVGDLGGRVEITRAGSGTRIGLVMPARS